MEQLFKEEADVIQKSLTIPLSQEQKERLEREKWRFRYICCNQTVQLLGSLGGCTKGKHSPGSVTLDEWEQNGDNNKEYQDKRWSFLQSRIWEYIL
jgi:hypothetical protein